MMKILKIREKVKKMVQFYSFEINLMLNLMVLGNEGFEGMQ